MTAVVSHELRNPMESCLFFLKKINKLGSSPGDAAQAKVLSKLIVSQINFMLTFVEDLVALGMIKKGCLQLVHKRFNPQDVIDLVHTIFTP